MTPRESVDRQFDLFVPFISDLPLRDQRETMERPFFSLSKNKRLKPIEYGSPDGKVWVKVVATNEFGMATIWDADVLIWAASVLSNLKRGGLNDLPRTLQVQPYDLLRTIGRDTGGRQYGLLRESLARLQATTIVTNIRAENTRKKQRQFSWIESWTDVVDDETGHSQGMTITLSDWFYEGVVMEGGLLAINPAYFGITGGRERWIYRIARKHAGGAGEGGFAIPLDTLFEKSGAEGTYRRFKFELAALAKRNQVPEFHIAIEEAERGEPVLRMVRRDMLPVDHEAFGPSVKSTPKSKAAPKARLKKTAPVESTTVPLFRHLADDTLERLRRDFLGWDFYALQSQFNEWLDADPKRMPADYQAAFYGFVKQHHAKHKHELRRG